jgi:hypothetical protein
MAKRQRSVDDLREQEEARQVARIREAQERAERAAFDQAREAEYHARMEAKKREYHAELEANRRLEWEQRVEQGLSALLTATGAVAVAEPTDTAAAIAVKLSVVEIVAEGLRAVFPQFHGVPKGLGWKRADRALKAHGYDDGVPSKNTYHRALNKNRARLAQSQP